MKTNFFKGTAQLSMLFFSIFFLCTTITKAQSKNSLPVDSLKKITIVYQKPVNTEATYLGSIKVPEKFVFFHGNKNLKEETIAELKKQAEEKGGNIVYVNNYTTNGLGLIFTRTVYACVYKLKQEK